MDFANIQKMAKANDVYFNDVMFSLHFYDTKVWRGINRTVESNWETFCLSWVVKRLRWIELSWTDLTLTSWIWRSRLPWMTWPQPSQPALLCLKSTTVQRLPTLGWLSTSASTVCWNRVSDAGASLNYRKGTNEFWLFLLSHWCLIACVACVYIFAWWLVSVKG